MLHELFPAAPSIPLQAKIEAAVARVNAAIDQYKPVAVFGLLSGGNDSLPATFVATQAKQFDGVLHINTGFGVEATREFVRSTCAEQGWKLLEYKALENIQADGTPDPQDYEQIVLEHGFPGPMGHGMMYARLKERQLQRIERDFGAACRYKIPKAIWVDGKGKLKGRQGWRKLIRAQLVATGEIEKYFEGKRIMYVTGVRSQESRRRMGFVQPIQARKQRLWVAAIHDWSQADCAAARDFAGLKQNIVCERIGISGECLCGAFAKPGELEALRGWPETHPMYLRICALQERAKAAGFTWGWGERPPANRKPSPQHDLFDDPEMPLCHNCVKHHGGRD